MRSKIGRQKKLRREVYRWIGQRQRGVKGRDKSGARDGWEWEESLSSLDFPDEDLGSPSTTRSSSSGSDDSDDTADFPVGGVDPFDLGLPTEAVYTLAGEGSPAPWAYGAPDATIPQDAEDSKLGDGALGSLDEDDLLYDADVSNASETDDESDMDESEMDDESEMNDENEMDDDGDDDDDGSHHSFAGGEQWDDVFDAEPLAASDQTAAGLYSHALQHGTESSDNGADMTAKMLVTAWCGIYTFSDSEDWESSSDTDRS
jgi:hypothetical protein